MVSGIRNSASASHGVAASALGPKCVGPALAAWCGKEAGLAHGEWHQEQRQRQPRRGRLRARPKVRGPYGCSAACLPGQTC